MCNQLTAEVGFDLPPKIVIYVALFQPHAVLPLPLGEGKLS